MEVMPIVCQAEVRRFLHISLYGSNSFAINAVTSNGIFFKQYSYEVGRSFLSENIPSIGRIGINTDGNLVINNRIDLDLLEISSDINTIVDSVNCTGLKLSAPNVLVIGETSIPIFLVNSTGLSRDRGVMILGTLSTRQMGVVGGKVNNRGIIDFGTYSVESIGQLKTEFDLINDGEIRGCCDLTTYSLFNNGDITGDEVVFLGKMLHNSGTIGNERSILKFMIQEHMLNAGDIIGLEAEFDISNQKSFSNSGTFRISKMRFVGPKIFVNNGFVFTKEFSGSVTDILNRGNFDAPELSMRMDSVRNHGLLKLRRLEIIGNFKNQSRGEQNAVFQSEQGIKLDNFSEFIDGSQIINTDLSIPKEKSTVPALGTGLISGWHNGHIINMRPDFRDLDTFNLDQIRSLVDFYISVENLGEKVQFSLFQRGTEKISLALAGKDFDKFVDRKGDCFYLRSQGENIVCHLFDPRLNIAYGFLLDFVGNIELSANRGSNTGAEHSVRYAFHTNKVLRNRNPIAFHSLITDSRELCNFSILKARNYLFRYMYRYNSGILNLKSSHSSNTDIQFYRDQTFLPRNLAKPMFRVGEEDNYGVILGDDTAYFGIGSTVGFYGITLLDSIVFRGMGNAIVTKDSIFDISGSMSGEIASFCIKSSSGARSFATVGRIPDSSMKWLENEGILLVKEPSHMHVRNVFLTGIIAALHSLNMTYGQIVGGGSILAGDLLTFTKEMPPDSLPDMVTRVAPKWIVREETPSGKKEKEFEEDAASARKFIVDLMREFEVTRKGGEILDRLEATEKERIYATLAEHGSINHLFMLLRETELPSEEINQLLAVPYSYECADIDLQIFHLHRRISTSVSPEKEAKSMFQLTVIWKTNIENLKTKTPDLFEIYIKAWRRNWFSTEEIPMFGKGIDKFLNFVRAIGKKEVIEKSTSDFLEQKLYSDTFEYIKQLADERLNLH
jgi:hypothetical protein